MKHYGFIIEFRYPYCNGLKSEYQIDHAKKIYKTKEIALDAIEQMTKSQSWPSGYEFRIREIFINE